MLIMRSHDNSAAKLLADLRKRAGLTIDGMAKQAGIPKTTYANYENRFKGRYLPAELLEKVSPALLSSGVSVQEMADLYPSIAEPIKRGGMAEYQPPAHNRPSPPLASVPEFGHAAATDGHIEGLGTQYPVDVIDIRLPEGCFAVRVAGSSMVPRYRQGDIVLIHPNRWPDAGQDCLIETLEGHGYIKTFLKKTAKTYIFSQSSTKELFEIDRMSVKQLHAVKCRWG